MIRFQVKGPFPVPLYKGQLAADVLREQFWPKMASFADEKGCYLFVEPPPRRPGSLWPIYVGKAERNFRQEIFAPEKLNKLNRYLLDRRAKEIRIFFVTTPSRSIQKNSVAIRELERWLIRLAVSVNLNLINKHGTKPEEWGVQGIIRSGTGRPSAPASALRGVLGLDGRGAIAPGNQGSIGPAVTGSEPDRATDG